MAQTAVGQADPYLRCCQQVHASAWQLAGGLMEACAAAGKYMLMQGNFRGGHIIEVEALTRAQPGRRVTCTFFASTADYHHQVQLHELLPASAAVLGAPVVACMVCMLSMHGVCVLSMHSLCAVSQSRI